MTLRTLVLPPYAAYLRVYEPLAAFAEPERRYWEQYAAERLGPAQAPAPDPAADADGEAGAADGAGAAEPSAEGARGGGGSAAGPVLPTALDERRRRLADLTAVPPITVPEEESREAFLHLADGVLHICPWQTRLRTWLALAELAEDLPISMLDLLVPPSLRRRAEADWERWRADHPDGRPWILTSGWDVPVQWFLLFGSEERDYTPGTPAAAASSGEEGDQGEEGGTGGAAGGAATGLAGAAAGAAAGGAWRRVPPVLRYRTPMSQARKRLARGFRVLRETLEDSPLVDEVESVGRWLEEFHPRSLVELDYGGLVYAIPEADLAADHSARDVELGIAALREGDGERAARCRQALAERWRRVQEMQFAN